MKNILKTYFRNHIQFINEFMLLNNLNSWLWNHIWNHIMNSSLFLVIWKIQWTNHCYSWMKWSSLHDVSNEGIFRNLQVDLLSTGKGLNLKDTTQKEQSDLQKVFKQKNAKDGIAMHNSKYCPKNDVEIYWRKFSWKMPSTMLLAAALCQHRHKQDAGCFWGSTRS